MFYFLSFFHVFRMVYYRFIPPGFFMESFDVCLVAWQMVCKGLRYRFFLFFLFCFILLILLFFLSGNFFVWCILVLILWGRPLESSGVWLVWWKKLCWGFIFSILCSLLCFHAIFVIKYFYSPGCFVYNFCYLFTWTSKYFTEVLIFV